MYGGVSWCACILTTSCAMRTERAIRDWFATRRDYEEFRSLYPDESPRFYLEEAGEFAARYLGEGAGTCRQKWLLGSLLFS
jgi:hypothetical protein